jgi:uncharacterized protein
LVRAVAFEYPDDWEPHWNPRFPEFACAANAVSLLMPHVEPYVVDSVAAALPDVPDRDRATTRDYLRQERAHYRQHRRFNDLLLAAYPRLGWVERAMARSFAWLGRRRSSSFNLAFAAGFETVAYTTARWTDRHLGELFTGADPVPTTLLLWHLAEEVEHKTVAFDAYEAAGGGRLRYGAAMALSAVLLSWFTVLATLVMLFSDGRLRYPVTHFRLMRWFFSLAFSSLPTMVVSALPGHHPRDLADPPFLTAWLRHYDPATRTLPVWHLPGGGLPPPEPPLASPPPPAP